MLSLSFPERTVQELMPCDKCRFVIQSPAGDGELFCRRFVDVVTGEITSCALSRSSQGDCVNGRGFVERNGDATLADYMRVGG